ncbi:putative RNA 3'-terminal phosphate cyclase-like protein [Operophtera brumata]|uniref:Putative RNA 3'-terminal phosphate cyclase-like protein n=1 Tax=Operophtera brumata TaxID=104452 RepID=A0A0L7L704_OPEBR|nr:putative RNA 3'-terminal phosphate cyclase-like protein [Operophtera brumata]
MPATVHNDVLVYKGSNFFRQRLLLATLSGRAIRIEDIRSSHDDPGLREYEVNLIRLLDKVTNGTRVELGQTGTSMYYEPGLLIGGQITHSCCPQRGIGYYLEILLALGPFCKEPLNAVLQGVTHSDLDVSVDKIKTAALPVLLRFILVDDGLELKVVRRGYYLEILLALGPFCKEPLNAVLQGVTHSDLDVSVDKIKTAALPVLLRFILVDDGLELKVCPVRRHLRPLQCSTWGLVKRIRGVVYALRVSPTMANRVVESAKGVMLKFLPDVYINTDQCRGPNAGKSPGFGVSLVAETDDRTFYCAEAKSADVGTGDITLPEDIGRECAQRLLDEIYRGGAVDSSFQWLHLKDFFGVMFKLEVKRASDDDGSGDEDQVTAQSIKMTCVGIGYVSNQRMLVFLCDT